MWSFMKSGSVLVKENKMILLRKTAITWSGIASGLRGRLRRNRQPWLLVAALMSLVVVANTVLTVIWNNEQSKHWIAFTSFSFDSQPALLDDQQLLCLAFARYSNPHRSIALFVDNVSRTTAATDFLLRHQIQVIPMELDHERIRTFQANYRHCSMNEIRYETMCFARFLFLDIYFARRPEVRSVAHVDLDIALLVEDKPPLPAGTDIFFIKESSSFFSRFTRRGLAGYAHYIEQFYNRDAESIMTDVLKYGQELPPDRRDDWYLHHMLQDWYNISSLAGVTPKQFSDMHLTALFSRQHSSTMTASAEDLRVKVMFPDPIRLPPMEYRVLVNANQMEGWTFCQYPTGGMYKLNWQLVRQTRQPAAVNYRVTLPTLPQKPVWGIHFQATCKEAICRILCPHIVSADKGMIGCCGAT
jgi:hypothetical protein